MSDNCFISIFYFEDNVFCMLYRWVFTNHNYLVMLNLVFSLHFKWKVYWHAVSFSDRYRGLKRIISDRMLLGIPVSHGGKISYLCSAFYFFTLGLLHSPLNSLYLKTVRNQPNAISACSHFKSLLTIKGGLHLILNIILSLHIWHIKLLVNHSQYQNLINIRDGWWFMFPCACIFKHYVLSELASL